MCNDRSENYCKGTIWANKKLFVRMVKNSLIEERIIEY